MIKKSDRAGAALAFGFLLLLLGSEGALTLPDADATDAAATAFYADHRTVVVVLQVVGFVAAGLLAAYLWRLRGSYPWTARTGVVAAALACVPGVVTAVAALVADKAAPAAAGRWNAREPWGDRALFAGFLVVMAVVVVELAGHPVVRALAAVTALQVAARLALELAGAPPGPLAQVAPIAFLVTIGALGVASLRGTLMPPGSPTAAAGSASAGGGRRRR